MTEYCLNFCHDYTNAPCAANPLVSVGWPSNTVFVLLFIYLLIILFHSDVSDQSFLLWCRLTWCIIFAHRLCLVGYCHQPSHCFLLLFITCLLLCTRKARLQNIASVSHIFKKPIIPIISID